MWQFSHSSTVEWFSQVWEICRWSNFLTETSRSYLLTSLIPSLKVRVCKQCRPKVGSWGTWLDWLRGHFSALWLDPDFFVKWNEFVVFCGQLREVFQVTKEEKRRKNHLIFPEISCSSEKTLQFDHCLLLIIFLWTDLAFWMNPKRCRSNAWFIDSAYALGLKAFQSEF